MNDKYIGVAKTKEEFAKLLEKAQNEIKETEIPVLYIIIGSSEFRISLDNPIKGNLEQWNEITDKWGEGDFEQLIREKALSEISRKIESIKARIIESIESRKEGKEKPLEGKYPYGLLAIEQLREIERNYQRLDKDYSIKNPYLLTKKMPYELKFMALLAGLDSLIRRANLLEKKQENPILDLYNKYKVEDRLKEKLKEFDELNQKPLEYERWKKNLAEEFDIIIGKKAAETQALNQTQTLDEKLDQVEVSQNSNAQVFTAKFDTVGEILEGIKKREAATMLAKLNGELKSQSFSVDETVVDDDTGKSQNFSVNKTVDGNAIGKSQNLGFLDELANSEEKSEEQSSSFVNKSVGSNDTGKSQSFSVAETVVGDATERLQSLSSLGELSNNSVEIQKEEKWGDFYNLGKATTKEDFAKLLEEAQKKANKNTKFIVEIGIGSDVYEIVLPSPISKTNHKKWTEILDKWGIGDLNLKEFIRSESISKIQKGLEVIENKIGTESSSLKKEAHLSRFLANLEETYTAGVDWRHILSSPLHKISEHSPFYIIGKNAPSKLKFMGFLKKYVDFAILLERTKDNPILEASRQYKLKDKFPEQVFKWSQLNRGSKKYKDWKKESKEYRKKYKEWKKELSREVSKIFKLIKIKEKEIKEKQNLNSVNKSVASNGKRKSQNLFSINNFFLGNIGNLLRFIKEDKKNSFIRNMLRALFHFITGSKKNSKGIPTSSLNPIPKEIGFGKNISQIEEAAPTIGSNERDSKTHKQHLDKRKKRPLLSLNIKKKRKKTIKQITR